MKYTHLEERRNHLWVCLEISSHSLPQAHKCPHFAQQLQGKQLQKSSTNFSYIHVSVHEPRLISLHEMVRPLVSGPFTTLMRILWLPGECETSNGPMLHDVFVLGNNASVFCWVMYWYWDKMLLFCYSH